MTNNETQRMFVVTAGSRRIWLSCEAPSEVHDYLRESSKWGGSDKRQGARVSFEISRDLSLEAVSTTLVEMGMVHSNSPEVMNNLVYWSE